MKLSGMFRTGTVISVAVLGAVGLTGCADENVRDMFSEPQTPADVVSESVQETAFMDIDRDSTRLLWVDGDTSYYAGTSPDHGTCVIVDDGIMPSSSCSDRLPLSSSTTEGGPARVMLSGSAPTEAGDWEKVADFLWQKQ